MATKSLGHLSVATGNSLFYTSACNVTTLNGSASACDMAQFNAVGDTTMTADPAEVGVEETTDVTFEYTSQGSRHTARIAIRSANYTFDEDSGGRILSLDSSSGDSATYLAVGDGEAQAECDYDDGGYNNTTYATVTISVA